MSGARIHAWAFGVSLATAFAIILPYFWLGSAAGHDFQFHVASWLDVAYQWRSGVVYPRWTTWTNHGFGEPRYIFYPPLSWILGAALTLVVPIDWVPGAFVVVAQTLAGYFCFLLLRRLTSERGALLGSVSYSANPNLLLMTYLRSDFAEQLACAVFPLLLLEALRLSGLLSSEPEGNRIRSLPGFALGFSAMWLSNAPAGVIAAYSMVLVFAIAAALEKSWGPLGRGACGLGLGLGLAGFYLVPATYEQRWVNIGQALSSGLRPWQNFLYTNIADVEHTWFNWISSTCAVALILMFLLSAWQSQQFSKKEGKNEEGCGKTWIALLVLGSCATVLMIGITKTLWMYLPKLRYVQFPWRWMSVVALAYSCFLAVWAQRKRGWIAVLTLLVLSIPGAYVLIENGWWDPDEMPTERVWITDGTGFDGTDEYDPLGDDHTDLPIGAPLATIQSANGPKDHKTKAEFRIVNWAPEKKEIVVRAQEPAVLALRLLNYPAWRVTLNGKRLTPGHPNGMEQMLIPVEIGDAQIDIRFIRTPDRTIGLAVSAFGTVVLLGLFLVRRISGTSDQDERGDSGRM